MAVAIRILEVVMAEFVDILKDVVMRWIREKNAKYVLDVSVGEEELGLKNGVEEDEADNESG